MNALDALTQLEQLLIDERDAVIHLDATAVESIVEEKEALMDVLRDGLLTLGDEHVARIGALRDSLRHNTILLAHARDCLRDALAAFHIDEPAGGKPAKATPRPGARISIRG